MHTSTLTANAEAVVSTHNWLLNLHRGIDVP